MNREDKLLSLPYHQRQFIYIVDDYNGLQSKKDNFFQDAGDVIGKTVSETLEDTFNPWRIAENWQKGKWYKLPLAAEVNAVTNVIESIKGKINEKDLSIYEFWKNEDIKPIIFDNNSRLKFPPAHPQKDTVYVAHPVKIGTYFPLADFHRLSFEHKWGEALNLLLHLGATEIEVVHKKGWNKDFAANLNLNIPIDGIPVESEGNVEFKENSTSDIISKFYLPDNDIAAELPDDLVWFDFEESWMKVDLARRKFKMDTFSIKLNYEQDLNVNADLCAKIREYGLGLGLGGSFVKHESTTWLLRGKFNSVPPKNTNS